MDRRQPVRWQQAVDRPDSHIAGVRIDLRNIKSPIVVFCSWGDDITPPQQALDWILDLYDDVKRSSSGDRPSSIRCITPSAIWVFSSPARSPRKSTASLCPAWR